MKKPNIKNYQYSNGEMRDLVEYTESLEEYIKHLESKAENLAISGLSDRRELLLAFAMRDLKEPISDFNREGFAEIVDDFLANNCG